MKIVMVDESGVVESLTVTPNVGDVFTRKDINNLEKWCTKLSKMNGILSCTLVNNNC